jgi:hypothetical protein
MLREFKNVRQIPGEPFRRWYSGHDSELIVWLDEYRVVGFQLVVPGDADPLVLTWHDGQALNVANLDDGEGRTGRSKMSPILVPTATTDLSAALEHFRTIAQELPLALATLVEKEIETHQAKRRCER